MDDEIDRIFGPQSRRSAVDRRRCLAACKISVRYCTFRNTWAIATGTIFVIASGLFTSKVLLASSP